MKKIALFILLFVVLSCTTNNKKLQNIVNSKVEMKVIKYNSDEYILAIQTTLINNSSNNLYFFEPSLMVYDGVKSQSAYSLTINDYEKNGLLDSLISNGHKSDTTRLGIRLRQFVKKYFSIEKEAIYGSFIEKCIFLRKNEHKILKEHIYLMKENELNGLYRFYLTNVSETENKKGYEIYKSLPDNFEGYRFWKGKIKSDTLDFLIRDLSLPNNQIKLNLPPTL